MLIDQISVFVENVPGRLCEILGVLAEDNIDIRALSLADTTNFGILRLIVDDHDKAYAKLKSANISAASNKVLAVKIPDVPGGMHKVLCVLKDVGVSVEYAYAMLSGYIESSAICILAVDDLEKGFEVLQANNMV